MTTLLDSLSPIGIGADKIVITKDQSSLLQAFHPVILNFDYSACYPDGVVLPIEIVVQPGFGPGGPGCGFRSKIFRRSAPTSYSFTPPSSGQYLVVIKELFHNYWQGRIRLEIAGDSLSDIYTERVI